MAGVTRSAEMKSVSSMCMPEAVRRTLAESKRAAPPKRPPHRPSRRSTVIDAAMGLFAMHPPESVTVADIAAAADMTAAAVYYHFPSKEHVLLEGLQHFTREFLRANAELANRDGDGAWARRFVSDLLEWLERHRIAAKVFFAHSAGVDVSIEALRRETRIRQVETLSKAIRTHVAGSRSSVEPEVASIGLVSLVETAATSLLTIDTVFLGLGQRRFLAEVGNLAQRVVGQPAIAPAKESTSRTRRSR
jgi:AcrR family transcriptional regulator